MVKQKTTLIKPDTAKRGWVIVDVGGKAVGRAASAIADILRGKHKSSYTPHVDNGDFVVAINASQIRLTGRKMDEKEYFHHTGYFGGIKSITAKKQLERHPERILTDAVWGMLPKNRLSRQLIKKLKVYPGSEHPHEAQAPAELKI